MRQLIIRLCMSLFFFGFSLQVLTARAATETALFALGCFWCAQSDFDKVPGVIKTIVGYTGGHVVNPTYQQVTSGNTGHYESIEVIYDSDKVTYQALLNVFWHNIDPTNPNGQFCDTGNQYRAVIFYANEAQKNLALESKAALEKTHRFPEIVTQILPATTFYPAEDYHQSYYQKNPVRYHYYRYTCGRDARLKMLWEEHP